MPDYNKETTPTDKDRLLRFIRKFCEPETCAAMEFHQFVEELGDLRTADKTLKDLWRQGLVAATNSEADPEDGALFEIPLPKLKDPIKKATRFVLTYDGYEAIDPLFDSNLESLSENVDVISPLDKDIVVATEFINSQLMRELEKNPEKMFSLNSRQFEEFVAELFLREGFDVELTPPRKDGGRDVMAVSHGSTGPHLYLAECKRYDPKNPVGVEYVRSLYGVLEYEKATRGILATTSFFTKGAKELANDLKWRMGLKDYDELKKWISKYRSS